MAQKLKWKHSGEARPAITITGGRANHMATLEEFKKYLGPDAIKFSDEEIVKIKHSLEGLARIAVNQFFAKRQKEKEEYEKLKSTPSSRK